MSDELAGLTEGLQTEIQRASCGECPESVVVLLADDRLPRVQITGSNGMVANKVISYAELLGALDESSVVASLQNENRRTTRLPELPDGVLLVDLHEEPAGSSYTITGYLPPDTICSASKATGRAPRLPTKRLCPTSSTASSMTRLQLA